ncbi:MAG: hypothetical protein RRY63_04965 [Acidaminococcaceae bacterium]
MKNKEKKDKDDKETLYMVHDDTDLIQTRAIEYTEADKRKFEEADQNLKKRGLL